MKRPDLPAEHCANQPVEEVRRMFVRHIAPELKTGSINARRAISELQTWREYHPEAFDDWEQLCWTYIEQPPQWVDWLIAGVKATSDKVTKADELVAAALKTHGGDRRSEQAKQDQGTESTLKTRGGNPDYLKARMQRDHPEIAEALDRGKIKSTRAAAIEAGIIKPVPSIQLKEPAPTAQKLLSKKGKAWCLQLMEELSELVLNE
jgi:hypothetical protein